MVYFAASMGLVGFVLVAFLISEWRSYLAGRGILNRRLMITRTISGSVLLLLLGMVCWGSLRLPYVDRWQVFWYWSAVLAVLLILLAFLMIDYRLLRQRTEEIKEEMSHHFVEELEVLARKARKPAKEQECPLEEAFKDNEAEATSETADEEDS